MPRRLFILTLALLLGGCASTGRVTSQEDPWESLNRKVYSFNDQVDRAVLRPAAEVYEEYVPAPVSRSVSNFFGNLDDVLVFVNDIFQLKAKQGINDLARVAVNTTVGIGGLFDVATPLGLAGHNEDFGQTLGYWGVDTGPYLMLPFLGPSTLRDGTGVALEWNYDPLVEVTNDYRVYYPVVSVKLIDKRAGLLQGSRMLDSAALDPYIFLRSSYLQRRRNLVYDGNPPKPEGADAFDPFGGGGELDPFADPAMIDPFAEPPAP